MGSIGRAWIGGVLLLGLWGCSSVQPGDTVYRVKVDDRQEQKLVRLRMWRVARATEEVSVKYGLTDVSVEVIITNLDGLGQTTPTMRPSTEVDGAKMYINKRLFVEDNPDTDQILLGLVAHELAHALHYSRMSKADLAELGVRYDDAMKNPNGKNRDWVRAYEQLTDMTVIALGFGEPLIYQKRASEANLAENDPEGVWDFYLTEPEIRAMMDDHDLLVAEFKAALDVLKLPSLRSLPQRIELDDEGDIVPRSGG